MTGITSSVKQGEMDKFCDAVTGFANNVCGLSENAVQVLFAHSKMQNYWRSICSSFHLLSICPFI